MFSSWLYNCNIRILQFHLAGYCCLFSVYSVSYVMPYPGIFTVILFIYLCPLFTFILYCLKVNERDRYLIFTFFTSYPCLFFISLIIQLYLFFIFFSTSFSLFVFVRSTYTHIAGANIYDIDCGLCLRYVNF